jgi:hypothetical protein
MYLRTGSNVANLSLHEDGRIDCFEGFDRFFGLAHVLVEWQRGKIEDDGIKPGPGRFYCLRQGMGMIRVKKDWAVAFLPQTPHQSRNLPDSDKLTFALGRTDQALGLDVPATLLARADEVIDTRTGWGRAMCPSCS